MKIVIVGAGPAGLLAAHRLVQRDNYEVHVYEKRHDLRQENPANLRSYPIGKRMMIRRSGARRNEVVVIVLFVCSPSIAFDNDGIPVLSRTSKIHYLLAADQPFRQSIVTPNMQAFKNVVWKRPILNYVPRWNKPAR